MSAILVRVNTQKRQNEMSRQIFQQVVHVNDYLSKILEENKRHNKYFLSFFLKTLKFFTFFNSVGRPLNIFVPILLLCSVLQNCTYKLCL
jgi:hypothetical protein